MRRSLPILSIFLVSIVVYVYTLSRSVYGGDVGDLVTGSFVGGVVHPPGYPLFTLLGFILTRVAWLGTPAFAVGLISALSGSLGVVFFSLITRRLTKNTLVSVIGTLILAFSYLFWFYNEIAEVFALNNFFVLLLTYLFIRYFQEKKSFIRNLIFFVFGLAFTNHQTSILLLPSFLILLLPNLPLSSRTPPRRGERSSEAFILRHLVPRFLTTFEMTKINRILRTAFSGIFFFFLGLLPYLYIPFAAARKTVVNWDNVHDLASFLHLFLRKDYGTFTAGNFAPPEFWQRVVILKTYFLTLFAQLTPIVFLLSLVGMIVIAKKSFRLFLSFFIGFLLTGPIFVGYAGFPLIGNFYVGVYERFFILSSIILLIFFPSGLLAFTSFLVRLFSLRKETLVAIQAIFLIIPCMLFFYNFPKTNLSSVTIGDNLGKDLLVPLPKNSILLLMGDTALFNTWYVHYALHVRPDVQVINLNGLARDEKYESLKKQYLAGHPKANGQEVTAGVIESLSDRHPVFTVQQVEPPDGKNKFHWTPYGLVYRLTPENVDKKQLLAIWSSLHVPLYADQRKTKALGNLTIADIPQIYASALLNTGNYLFLTYKDKAGAFEFYQKALLIDPNFAKAYQVLGAYYFSDARTCPLAAVSFKKAIDLSPYEELSYVYLYNVYKNCLNDKKSADQIAKNFTKQFRVDFYKYLKDFK